MSLETTSMSSDWDASTYHRVSSPHVSWGRGELARLPLEGTETVVDACEAFLSVLAAMAASDDPPVTIDYWRLNPEGRRPESK